MMRIYLIIFGRSLTIPDFLTYLFLWYAAFKFISDNYSLPEDNIILVTFFFPPTARIQSYNHPSIHPQYVVHLRYPNTQCYP